MYISNRVAAMEQVKLFILLAGAAAFFFLLLCLFRPRLVLWCEDVQNRRKILRVYGSIAGGALFIYLLLHLLT